MQLKSLGYRVCIATHNNFESFVKSKGLEFALIAGNYQELLGSESGLNLLEGKGEFRLVGDDLLFQQLKDSYQAAIGSDGLIVFPLSSFGYHIAEKLNIPCIFSSFIPVTSTGEFPFLRFDLQPTSKLFSPLNRFSYFLVTLLSWQSERKIINKFRQEILQLSPINILGVKYRRNAPKNFKSQDIPILYQYSPNVIPSPRDWNQDNTFVTGNWFLEETQQFSPSQELENFLDNGSQPIYIGFGSMVFREPEKYLKLIVEAVKRTKQRAIIATSWLGMHESSLDNESILILDGYVPHGWLFEKTKVLIHHGGSGTSASALKSGVPQIIIPFFADQPAWGNQLVKLGVASASIPVQQLDAEKLVDAISTAVNNSQLQQKAQEIARLMAQEAGARVAAEEVENLIAKFSENLLS